MFVLYQINKFMQGIFIFLIFDFYFISKFEIENSKLNTPI